MSGATVNARPSPAGLARGSNKNLGGSDMTATDKLVEKNCLLAELMRLAAKKR
jgi:hypothetical protein